MTEVLISAQMRAIEAAAMASGAVTGLGLMERAGEGVVQAIFAQWPAFAPPPGALPRTPEYLGQDEGRRAVVLCGPGNNGGDGFVVARLLRERGWRVRVLAAAAPERMPPNAAENARRWGRMGAVEPLTAQALRRGGASDLYVDAVFGTGLSRPPEGEIADVLAHIGGRNGDRGYYSPRLVAIDAPSGLCLDSGRSLMAAGYVPKAQLTVTFDCLKAGHLLGQGPELCGRMAVVDIGIAPWRRFDRPRFVEGRWVGAVRPVRLGLVGPILESDAFTTMQPGAIRAKMIGKAGWVEDHRAHKFTHGHALVLSGPSGRGGAARLAARGALRIGAGLVTVGCPPSAFAENAARLDAVMLRQVADGAVLGQVLEDRRINALCLGPGMGIGLWAQRLLFKALMTRRSGVVPDHLAHLPESFLATFQKRAETRLCVVLDADALTILAQNSALFETLHEDCVLTPHAGEFSRLFPEIAAKLVAPATKGPSYSKVDATREAAARAGCVVLFKGPDTVIADPTGRCAINSAHYDRAAPWLATAGSGDVLAGFITGLRARGFSPFDAACIGAWLHVECALSFGPGLIAEDLPEAVPKVLRALGL
ncbi:NAD(P)H-hydrate dehydratase [Pseudotabrizicola sp. L79]|uniref:NAD(P)H-hydrate dehydratase n=1 Tax=Pseudotabrizicola sp. L79 TaxID=3118402 RepID=UPI002F94FD11